MQLAGHTDLLPPHSSALTSSRGVALPGQLEQLQHKDSRATLLWSRRDIAVQQQRQQCPPCAAAPSLKRMLQVSLLMCSEADVTESSTLSALGFLLC